MIAIGRPSVSQDTIQLVVSKVSTTATCIALQGDALLNGAYGVTFGDGIQCIGGNLKRLGMRTSQGGRVLFGWLASFQTGTSSSDYVLPLPETGIAARGQVDPTGGTLYYQVWYRDAHTGFCTPATFNLTNAIAITWTP